MAETAGEQPASDTEQSGMRHKRKCNDHHSKQDPLDQYDAQGECLAICPLAAAAPQCGKDLTVDDRPVSHRQDQKPDEGRRGHIVDERGEEPPDALVAEQ